jgi:hypothetical protein
MWVGSGVEEEFLIRVNTTAITVHDGELATDET